MTASNSRPPTLHDVAAAAGVSKSLVSLAVRGDPGVRAETRARILDAADRLGYRSNPWARSLVHGRSHLIGVLVDDLSSDYHTDVVRGVEDEAEAHGKSVVIGDGRRNPEVLRQRLKRMLGLGLDGAVIVSGKASTAVIGGLAPRVPLVVVGRPAELPSDVGQVSNDDRAGIRLAVHHLAAQGHRHIAHLSLSTRPASMARRASFVEAMHDLGLGATAPIFGSVPEVIDALTSAPGAPSAVCCSNDRGAVELIGHAIDAGLSVPDDLSVTGYDNVVLGARTRPRLTSVDQPRREMGARALRQLLDLLDGLPARAEVLAPTLVLRESTRQPRRD